MLPQETDRRNAPAQNIDHATAFIAALTGNAETIMDFRAVHETDRSIAVRSRRGTLAQHWLELCEMNNAGFGIYCTIAETDGAGRADANIVQIRAQFIDLDGIDATQQFINACAWDIKPSFGVQSSPGKIHIYWPVTPHGNKLLFTTVQRKLVVKFNADPTVVDPARIMRLPGSLHMKNPSAPTLVQFFLLEGRAVTTEALDLAMWDVQPSQAGVGATGDHIPIGQGDRAPDLQAAIDMLFKIDVRDMTDRNQWVAITGAYMQSVDPFDPVEWKAAYAAYLTWNEPYPGNDPTANAKVWNDTTERGTIVKGWNRLHKEATGMTPQQMRLLSGGASLRDQRILEDQKIGDDLQFAITPKILTLEQMQQDFIFIGTGSLVVNHASKVVRNIYDATNEYAASIHTFDTGKLDKDNQPIFKSVPAIKQWMGSNQRISVDTITWVPEGSTFCNSPERNQGGDRAYNLWSGLQLSPAPENWREWVQPFLNHVAYLVPDAIEAARFLQWCAHIFQHPGTLPHTCYLMVTETTGTGRGTLGSMLTRALRGYVAVNMNVDALFGGFNGRIAQKLLATVDEIREGNSVNRYEKQEAFKSKITEETRAINPKYGLQSVEKNCCRWLMFSNHHDALPFDNSDRRVIVIDNPTIRQPQEHYTWLNGFLSDQNFIASIQQYLTTLDLAGFNPHEPAPLNVAKLKSLRSMEGQADKDAKQFASQWPGRFATVSDLREFMGDDVPPPRQMHHVIKRAGMKSAHKQAVAGRTETVLIVRDGLSPEDIISVDKPSISAEIADYRTAFRSL